MISRTSTPAALVRLRNQRSPRRTADPRMVDGVRDDAGGAAPTPVVVPIVILPLVAPDPVPPAGCDGAERRPWSGCPLRDRRYRGLDLREQRRGQRRVPERRREDGLAGRARGVGEEGLGQPEL